MVRTRTCNERNIRTHEGLIEDRLKQGKGIPGRGNRVEDDVFKIARVIFNSLTASDVAFIRRDHTKDKYERVYTSCVGEGIAKKKTSRIPVGGICDRKGPQSRIYMLDLKETKTNASPARE